MASLNFDELETVEVTLGGKVFMLKPQRRSLLQRILGEAFKELPTDEKDDWVEGMFKNFERQLPVFPLLFGFEDTKSTEFKEALAHLKEWLSPAAAVQVFNSWWELNKVSDFFLRGGMALYPPNLVEVQKERFQEEVGS